jgi:hypothetical protein
MSSSILFSCEMKISTNAEKVDQHRDDVPCDHRPCTNQESIVDPKDLKVPIIAAIVEFMPTLDRCRSIAIKSGTAAKVVPKPGDKTKDL